MDHHLGSPVWWNSKFSTHGHTCMGKYIAPVLLVQGCIRLYTWKACLYGFRYSLQNQNSPFQQGVLAQAQHFKTSSEHGQSELRSLCMHHLDLSFWNTFLLWLPNSQWRWFWQSQSKYNRVTISFHVAAAH